MRNFSLFLFLSLCLNLQAFAKDIRLHCQATYNSSSMETDVVVAENVKEISLGEVGIYELFVKSLGNNIVELQILDLEVPERIYATATVSKKQDVNLSVWRRESLFEARCGLIE